MEDGHVFHLLLADPAELDIAFLVPPHGVVVGCLNVLEDPFVREFSCQYREL